MRKLLLSLSLLVIALVASAATETALRVNLLSGEPVTFLLSGKPEVSFSGDKLQITDNAHPAGIFLEFNNIAHLDFAEVSAIDKITFDAVIIVTYDRGRVDFANIPSGTEASVFTLDGRCVNRTSADGSYSVSLSDFAPGIYIVRVGNIVTKIRL